MAIFWLMIIGITGGYLTTRILRIETDIITTVAIGITGALVGGIMLRTVFSVFGDVAPLVGAIVGVVALVVCWKVVRMR